MIEKDELRKIKEDFEKCKSIKQVAKKYHRAPKTINEIVNANSNCTISFCAKHTFPIEMQLANNEIKKFMQTVRESATYC